MVKKTIETFTVDYLQVMDENGNVDEELMPKVTDKQIKDFYEWMIFARAADTKAIALQRQGRMGTYASILGQEAAQIGSAMTLNKDDWIAPSYREIGALMVRNHHVSKLYMYYGGDERGHDLKEKNMPVAIPVSSQNLYATGIAMALRLQKKKAAVISYLGDGASSKGDFYEAANFAGVFKSPIVFFCSNNQFAISLSRNKQTAANTIAQKAIACGFNGIQIDGNDIFAVYKATREAVENAKQGNGPTLIEAFTYRMGDHTTSDDAKRYRTDKEVAEWKKKDPITRLQKYMKAKGLWTDAYEKEVQKKTAKKVEEEVKAYESIPAPKIDDMFTYQFAEMPDDLKEQLAYLKQFKQ